MVRVASYNIRKSIGTDWQRRPSRVLAVLRALDADVVALQEADRRFGARTSSLPPELIAGETDYKPVRLAGRPTSLGWHGNAILVRRSIEIVDQERLHLPALEPRGAVRADLRVDGLTLRVVAMHLGIVGFWRRRQARSLLDRLTAMEVLPTVMLGDLNEWNNDGGLFAHFAELHHVTDPGPSFHSQWRIASLDRIITSLDLKIEASGVVDTPEARLASDHLPVWADLSPLPQPAGQIREALAKSTSS